VEVADAPPPVGEVGVVEPPHAANVRSAVMTVILKTIVSVSNDPRHSACNSVAPSALHGKYAEQIVWL